MGVFAGILLSGVNDAVNAILMGVSAGTFIFIASAEIIVEEFAVSRNKFWKYIFYLLGIALMSSVFWIEKATGGED